MDATLADSWLRLSITATTTGGAMISPGQTRNLGKAHSIFLAFVRSFVRGESEDEAIRVAVGWKRGKGIKRRPRRVKKGEPTMAFSFE